MRSKTPSAPAWATLARWETLPSMGVASSLKSPVWTMVPMGVRITSPELSGMEWVMRKRSRVKYRPTWMRSSGEISFRLKLPGLRPNSSSLPLKSPRVSLAP
jgi:hypothetical protein